MDSAWRGDQAMKQKDFAAAIAEYTTALKDNPKGASFYLKRSECHLRLKPADPVASLLDAERAHVLASALGRREQIGQAQLRRGHALYISERYSDAQQCFAWTKKLLPKDKTIEIWEAKTTGVLQGLLEGDQKGVLNVKEKPELSLEKAIEEASSKSKGDTQSKGSIATTSDNTSTAFPAASTQQKPAETTTSNRVQTPPSKIRHEWYQTPDAIILSLMVKGVPKDKANIDIQPGVVSISFPLPTGSDYDFSLDPLFAQIDPSKSTHKVLSTKIELSLKKSEAGRKWHSLEGTEPISTEAATSDDQNDTVREAVLRPATNASAPAYPTSSKSGPKNWDKVASDLTKKSTSKTSSKDKAKAADDDDTDEEAKEQDEAEDPYVSDDEADPVNGFFKKLYKNADPDTRRAMMKSYTESNGTALSTNWSEVGKAPVETSPPDGMVAKQWGKD
ncbi:hypothetical protein MMC10_001020 [Thelotrema lepadinum]|nr:hypothetical protein [Thelotrema lepadinum]